ncbi:MAG: hypothetical protein Q8941_13535 [Bacteroidota bacterium]|nr:hypothetical protein [Bacteroidota bacterium]
MKRIACLFIATFALIASGHTQEKKAWKEMNDFHTIMQETFHPSEEGKLDPIKSRSREMMEKAITWEKSTAPEGYDKKIVSASLKKLVRGTRELNDLVKAKAADKIIKEKLSGLHSIFHEIMEKCENEEHH